MKKLYCVITGIDENALQDYISQNHGNDSGFYKKETHVGRIMMAKFINKYFNDEYEFISPIGSFAITKEEMNGTIDVHVSETIMRCFLNVNDAIALSKKINNNPVMGRGINVDIINEKKYNNMKKNKIKLNEAQLRNVIKTTVKKILREQDEYANDDYEENEDVFDSLLYYLDMGMRQCQEQGDANSQVFQLMQQLYDAIHYEDEEEPEYFDDGTYNYDQRQSLTEVSGKQYGRFNPLEKKINPKGGWPRKVN